MAKSLKDRLIEILIKGKLITRKQLERAINEQKKKGGRLSDILVEQDAISEKDLMVTLSEELNIPPINLSKYKVKPEVASLLPEKLARRYHLMPVSKIANTLMVAMADPLNVFAIDDIKIATGLKIDPIIATEEDINEAIEKYYTKEKKLDEFLEGVGDGKEVELTKDEELDIGQAAEESQTAPIVKIVDLILVEALKQRSSDIHIEPQEDQLRIRYRVDGGLKEALLIPKRNQNAVIARLKIMSNLDITETRIPQDGRFKVRLGPKEIDFRVSILPIVYGGKIVLRALDKSNLSVGLESLGFLPGPLADFEEALRKPYGMILVTGPTGSGKSTTLYSVLNKVNKPDRNIVTIEDPVEYQLPGITQVQVIPDIGLSFANGLRSILRQSPDIIMVGEIRDHETADIAIKASLTGELLFSTLHTNDAIGAITRLMDMGIEPFLIASSLVLVAAQRLCRKICSHCKEEIDIPDKALKDAGIIVPAGKKQKFYKGRGCVKCNQSGYLGRMGTLETLVIDDKIREMIVQRASHDAITEYARGKGMKSLFENAVTKLLNGDTTLEEVLRITSEE